MGSFIDRVKSLDGSGILVAADMAWKQMEPIVNAIGSAKIITGYKIGYITAFKEHGQDIINDIHDRGGLAVVDLQKLGADVPFIIKQQTQEAIDAGADAIIYDPFKDGCEDKGAPHALAVLEPAYDAGVDAITVIHMTNEKGNLYEFIRKQMVRNIHETLTTIEDKNYSLESVVLPGNQLEVTHAWIERLESMGYNPIVVGPGIGKDKQGGEPEFAGKYADIFVIGRAITGAEDPLAAAQDLHEAGMKGYKAREVA